jgi:hypothetical protein
MSWIHLTDIVRTYISEDRMTDDTPLDADSRVVRWPEKQGAVAWPLPVEAKLEALLHRAEEAGERTSRKEVVAALIAAYKGDGKKVSALVRRYRRTTVRELLAVPQSENVIDITQRRKPGPRPRSHGTLAREEL